MQTKTGALKARSAGAIVASALCHGIPLKAGAKIPRSFIFNGINAIIENGVCEDITGSGAGLTEVVGNPADEVITLSPSAPRRIRELIGAAKLDVLGIRF